MNSKRDWRLALALAASLGLTFASPLPAQLVNGSFETPGNVYPYRIFGAGLSLPGWTIERGTVEIVGSYWEAASGSQSLDLNGIFEDIGTIYQDVPTSAAHRYRVRFALAGNPECGPTVAVKSLRVYWDGNELAPLQFDTTGHSATNMGWTYQEFTVVASGSSSRLKFESTCPSFCGPALDDVSVTPLDPVEPPSTNAPTALSNGGFEQPPGIGTYAVFGSGAGLPGWTVEKGTVEIVGPYWDAAEGSQSLDLNGIFEQIGTIYQDVATVAGERYRVRFAFAGNPACGPAVKSIRVTWGEELLGALDFDTTGRSVHDMGWRYHEYMVTAASSSSRLRFQSMSGSFCGPALDDISVVPLNAVTNPPAPPTNSVVVLTNGGFETPGGISTWRAFGPWASLPGWTIESGTVEIIGPYFQSAEGLQALDLNGIYEEIGTIYQDVTTVPGEQYRLRFALAGNPECGPAVKSLRVYWDATELGSLSFDTTGRTAADMGWTYHEFVMTATASTGRLRFQSTSPSFCGPTLDAISITPLNQVTNPPPPPPPPGDTNTFANGGFESPEGIEPYLCFDVGRPVPGWTVESGTVDVVGTYWRAAEGRQSLDLNGIYEEIGTIYQDVPTLPDERYRVRFALAGNPECGPAIKSVVVTWDSQVLASLEFDTTGRTVEDMGWAYHEYFVTAQGDHSRLKFRSTSSSFCGPALDDVSVSRVLATGKAVPLSVAAFPPPVIALVLKAQPQLTLYGNVGRVYRIECSDTPVSGAWQSVAELVLPNSPFTWTDSRPPVGPGRFYRAVLVH